MTTVMKRVVVLVYALCAANLLRAFLVPALSHPAWDFLYFWTAGEAWQAGVSPYDGDAVVNAVPAPHGQRPFFYPPATRILFEPLALLPFEAARAAFAGVAVALWGVAAVLTTRRLPPHLPAGLRAMIVPVAMATGFVAVRSSLKNGQTIPLLVAAFAVLLAMPEGRRPAWVVAIALVVFSFKPHLGLPLAAITIIRWGSWRAVAGASFAVLTLSLFGAGGDPIGTVTAFAHNVTQYGRFIENQPQMTSGLPMVLSAHGAPAPPATVLTLIATALATAAAWSSLPTDRAAFVGLAGALAIMPSHTHDYLILLPLIPVVWAAPSWTKAIVTIGAVLLAQSVPIAASAPRADMAGGFLLSAVLDTAGIALIAGATAAWLCSRSRCQPVRSRPIRAPG